MPTGKDADGNAATKTFEGEYHYWDYGTREGVSEIQVFRNFETAFKQGGFTIIFEQSPNIITAHKGDTWYMLDNKGSFYYQTIVTVKPMTQEVTADASTIADELNKSGHRALRHSPRDGQGGHPARLRELAGRDREDVAAEPGCEAERGRPHRQRRRGRQQSGALRKARPSHSCLAYRARSGCLTPESQGLGADQARC